jgi:hypothetical protein
MEHSTEVATCKVVNSVIAACFVYHFYFSPAAVLPKLRKESIDSVKNVSEPLFEAFPHANETQYVQYRPLRTSPF